MLRLTIGIPSYNEGAKIISLIRSVHESTLNGDETRITEIIICDHSSDSTPQIIRSFMSEHHYLPIHLVHHDERGGAAAAWNEIFSLATGDIIVLFDADVLPPKDCISELASCMDNDKVGLCASNPICLKPNSSAARAASFISSWLGSIRKRGVSQYTVMGRSLCIRTDLAKRIIIPRLTIAIDLYLQCRILELGYHILYREKARVYFTPPSTMEDFASQVIRSRNGHRQISTQVRRLGINASPWSVLMASVKTTYGNPTDAFFMLLCSFLLPLYCSRLTGTNSYKWTIATSTKGQTG
jgi:cellulose synthase/poly-beta-1,6-N-acetylglucosamine synthase-like glycosyltransferase